MVVVLAFAANIVVALAKTAAAAITGSASLLAEAAHSWADAGNEVFLLVADRRSSRESDSSHPLGHGREAYVWALFAAFGVFTVGAVVAVANGIQELIVPEPTTNFAVAYIVLGVSTVLEGASLAQSVVRARRAARGVRRDTIDYVLNGSNTTLRAVVAEDTAALAGLAVAALGIGLHQATGIPAFDAAGSIVIGLILAAVALLLIDRNRRYLVGLEPPEAVRQQAGLSLLSNPEIDRVTYLHLEFVGPSQLFLVAAIDLIGDGPEDEVARRLRRIEDAIAEDRLIHTVVLTLSVSDEESLSF
jgi:cation diffusion facilitator family transporter